MTLAEELKKKGTYSMRIARANYYSAYFFLGVAVIASAVASIAVAARANWDDAFKAALAAVPGIVVFVMATFRFDARAEWWWRRYHGIDKLRRELEYENRQEDEVNKELTAFIENQDAAWPGFGSPSGR
jgi:hypothetical protein